ncbi:MAG: FAD-dependent oxidoreductase [Actinomycetes bacterium]|jgi:glycine/D-amino acid oxidase-like deaminating enzyme
MPYSPNGTTQSRAAVADAINTPIWLDQPERPVALDSLIGGQHADLAIVGGGFSGLWTAIQAKEDDPTRDVVILEGSRIGWAASGRNGGFCSPSITHGFFNGLERFPNEIRTLVRLGHENLEGLQKTIAHYQIDAEFELVGDVNLATDPYMLDGLEEAVETARSYGEDWGYLDQDAAQAVITSPKAFGGIVQRDVALVNPAKLAWGLRDAALSLGVRIYEHSPVTSMSEDGAVMVLTTAQGSVRAPRVALATNAFPPLLKRIRHYIVPVYDYVVCTEPLSDQQMSDIGWSGREGLANHANQFHYTRLTADNRILWGGYDATYYKNDGMDTKFHSNPETFAMLAQHLYEFLPALDGVKFTHTWGGAIDTCSRFSPFWGTANSGKVAYVAGYTGLGVGATRFGARVMLDLLSGKPTELTELEYVKTKPLPFPPEPLRSIGIGLTRWSFDKADRNEGKRNLWLRSLDKVGLGFDS